MSQKIVDDARSVGIVGKPHGIKGEVNVMLLTDYPDSILKGSTLYLDSECTHAVVVENIYIKSAKGHQSAVIMFQGVGTRDQAETLRGNQLYRRAQDSPDLEEGEYWIDDLVGCDVYLGNGKMVGRVEEVDILPANQNLAVRPHDGGSLVYIPLVDDYVEEVDISVKKVIIKRLPEYL